MASKSSKSNSPSKKFDKKTTAPSKYRGNKYKCNETESSSMLRDSKNIDRNDPRWYYINPDITDNAIRINFEEFVGRPYALSENTSITPLNVLAYLMAPTPNRSLPNNSAASNYDRDPGAIWAARKLYSALSSVTGRTVNYTPSTLCMLFYAIGEMLSMYSAIRRVFGYYRAYNRRNWGIPRSILLAMGINYEDFQQNIANYLTQFNTIVVDLNKIPILGSVTYFQKCVAMYDDVFSDMNADMAQLYLATPAYTWTLYENAADAGYPDSVAGSVLKTTYVAVGATSTVSVKSLSSWINIFKTQVAQLLESNTLQIVYSDILNYVTKYSLPVMTIPPIGLEYAQMIKFNENVNQQMHHAMQTGFHFNLNSTATFNADGTVTETGFVDWNGTDSTLTHTALNDVVEDTTPGRALSQILYYPLTRTNISSSGYTALTSQYVDGYALAALVYDADDMNESLDRRVDNTRYMVVRSGWWSIKDDLQHIVWRTHGGDHSVVMINMIAANDGGTTSEFKQSLLPPFFTSVDLSTLAEVQALALPPLTLALTNRNVGSGVGLKVAGIIGDLKDVTILSWDMLLSANKLIERDLLTVRDLKGFTG